MLTLKFHRDLFPKSLTDLSFITWSDDDKNPGRHQATKT